MDAAFPLAVTSAGFKHQNFAPLFSQKSPACIVLTEIFRARARSLISTNSSCSAPAGRQIQSMDICFSSRSSAIPFMWSASPWLKKTASIFVFLSPSGTEQAGSFLPLTHHCFRRPSGIPCHPAAPCRCHPPAPHPET